MAMLTTFYMSAMGVHIAKTTQTHKYIPSKSPEPDRKHDIEINMPKVIVGSKSEKEARHVEETHEIIFLCFHTCTLLKT